MSCRKCQRKKQQKPSLINKILKSLIGVVAIGLLLLYLNDQQMKINDLTTVVVDYHKRIQQVEYATDHLETQSELNTEQIEELKSEPVATTKEDEVKEETENKKERSFDILDGATKAAITIVGVGETVRRITSPLAPYW